MFSQILGMAAKKFTRDYPMDVSNNMVGAVRAYRQLRVQAENEGVSIDFDRINEGGISNHREATMALEKVVRRSMLYRDHGQGVEFKVGLT